MKSSASANLVIIQLLHTPADTTEFLRVCWDQLSPVQKKQIFHFLYIAKQHKTFVALARQELLRESPFIPWSELLALLYQWKKLKSHHLKTLIDTENPQDEIGLFRIPMAELNEIWKTRKKNKLTEYENKKMSLMKELNFAKNQGLQEKKSHALDQLQRFFPGDKVVEDAFLSDKEQKARKIYNRIVTKKEKKVTPKQRSTTQPFEHFEHFLPTIKKHLKKNPDYVYDFCLMFLQMDLPLDGLRVVDLMRRKSATLLWYELQLCLEAQQFARALSTIEDLQKNKITSDQSFSLLYYQAMALYGLGNKPLAIQIVKNILKIRPQFKSANSLLLEWESDL